jgi:proteic killer suppression protein
MAICGVVVINTVQISKHAEKDLKKAPMPIKKKLFIWIAAVEDRGLEEVRKISGFHDEPLLGERKGQRSIRLNKQWRAIYKILNEEIEFILIEEVTPHDY